jgi:hypothetical protein
MLRLILEAAKDCALLISRLFLRDLGGVLLTSNAFALKSSQPSPAIALRIRRNSQ